jgi:hypothetical protein
VEREMVKLLFVYKVWSQSLMDVAFLAFVRV